MKRRKGGWYGDRAGHRRAALKRRRKKIICPGCSKGETYVYNATRGDLQEMIELATQENFSGYRLSMRNHTNAEMREYLLELDSEDLDRLYLKKTGQLW